MFSQVCVKNSVHREGVCIQVYTGPPLQPSACWDTPLGRHPPVGRLISLMDTTADGTHPTGMHSC